MPILNLEEASKRGNLEQFIKEHPSEADERFEKLLDAMTTDSPAVEETSVRESSEGCSEIQTRQDTSQDSDD